MHRKSCHCPQSVGSFRSCLHHGHFLRCKKLILIHFFISFVSKAFVLCCLSVAINYLLLRFSLSFSNKSYLFQPVIRKWFLPFLYFLLLSLIWILVSRAENKRSPHNMDLLHSWLQCCKPMFSKFAPRLPSLDVFPLLPMLQTQLCFVPNKNWLPNY